MEIKNHRFVSLLICIAMLFVFVNNTVFAGQIVAWGQDSLGNGYIVSTVPGGVDYVAIAAGVHHALALKNHGSLVSWGNDDYGQVSNTPSGNDFVAIAAGKAHGLALREDGSIIIWGFNGYGEVSDTPTGNDFIAISGSFRHHFMALRNDGSIVSWGYDIVNVVSDTPTGTGFIAIAGGQAHSLALHGNGSIISWGQDINGLVSGVPVGNDFVAIAAGGHHSLALKNDGSIVSWGHDADRQVRDTPSGNDFVAIAGGIDSSLAIRSDGSIVYWGVSYNQVENTPVGTSYVAIAGSDNYCLALKEPIEIPGSKYSGGNGTVANPYQIGSVADWQELMTTPSDWNSSFILIADIDLAGIIVNPVGNESTKFRGILNGNSYVIRNLIINQPDDSGIGLFGYLCSGGEIKNLGVLDAQIQGNSYVGGIVGYNNGGTIASSYFDGAINNTGNYLGGLAGMNDQGTITSCYSTGIVSGHSYVGGLVGQNHYGTIIFCYTTGNVTGTYSQSYCIGGLVGWNWSATTTASYATGDVSSAGSLQVGGFVAVNTGTIDSCYAIGDVRGSSVLGYVGGFVSQNYNGGNIINSYSAGAVSANWYVGGFAGSNDTSVTSSFWDTQTSGNTIAVGNGSTDGITGKTTAEMQTLSTFLDDGWDFVGETANGTNDYWTMPEGGGYPIIAFWATQETTSLSLISPNGGENLISGEEFLIEWTSTDDISDVWIEYSIDGGQIWLDAEPSNIGNTGAYSWLIPLANSNQCLVRISDAANPSIYDISDLPFTIIQDNVSEFPTLDEILGWPAPAIAESGRDFVKRSILNEYSTFTILLEDAGYANQNILGIYCATNRHEKLELFTGPDSALDSVTVHFDAQTGIAQNLKTLQTAVFGDYFGFYLITPEGGTKIYYTDLTRNPDLSEHGLIFETVGFTDLIEGNPCAVISFEDLFGLGDRDYNDMVVGMTDVTVIPGSEPHCIKNIPGDFNNDCKVNLVDFAIMASYWMECNLDPQEACFE